MASRMKTLDAKIYFIGSNSYFLLVIVEGESRSHFQNFNLSISLETLGIKIEGKTSAFH